MKKEKTQLLLVTTLLLFAAIAPAGPTFSFEQITNNSGSDDVEDQLLVELVDYGGGYVEFLFTNSGPLASSIADIYFDNGNLGTISGAIGFVDGIGQVSFSSLASPGDLPGGNLVGFTTTTGMSADSDKPVFHNGINPGEQLGLTLMGDYDAVLNDILQGNLRIGLHVQGIGFNGEFSEGFVNTPVPIPAPGSIILGGIGIAIVGFLQKQKKLQAA